MPAWCIEQYSEAVEEMASDGHEIGFHGYIYEAPTRSRATRSITGFGAGWR